MGGGTYSYDSRVSRATTAGFYTKPVQEIFKQRTINESMSPYGVKVRESRDSDEHPESIAIILALDVTGSMGHIPHYIVRDGITNIMSRIMNKGIKDPQILFMGIGDHKYDSAPLQVGQFESSDDLLDKWLTSIFIEGGGGGNFGEDYLLAWYFAGWHTSIDCYEKRQRKGFLITIGDEPVIDSISAGSMNKIVGGQRENITAEGAYRKAKGTYNIRHLHMAEGQYGSNQEVINGWKALLGQDMVIVKDKNTIADIISDFVVSRFYDKPSITATEIDEDEILL